MPRTVDALPGPVVLTFNLSLTRGCRRRLLLAGEYAVDPKHHHAALALSPSTGQPSSP